MDHTVFVVENDQRSRDLYMQWIGQVGYAGKAFSVAEACFSILEDFEPSVLFLDLGEDPAADLEPLEVTLRIKPQISIVAIVSEKNSHLGPRAVNAGALSFLVKPVAPEEFKSSLKAAIQRHELVMEVRTLQAEVADKRQVQGFVGQSDSTNRISSQIGALLKNDLPVFVQGETGNGKELVARLIHKNSPRASGPFVGVNCGAIAREFQVSHIFGKGGGSEKPGFFEEANDGVLFLDEVGDLTLDVQAMLLRTLQDKVIRRVGDSFNTAVNVRIIAATNRNLKDMIARGRFREDLYYAIVVFPIEIPPLRERQIDIPLLVGYFLNQYCEDLGRSVPEISDSALNCLIAHKWVGNVRELQNSIQFTLLACKTGRIEVKHLPKAISRHGRLESLGESDDVLHLIDPLSGNVKTFDQLEMEVFTKARAIAGGNVTRTAEMLRIGRATIYRRMRAAENEKVQSDDSK
ncbi:MAG: sigma-54-dependent Fis family transcriptional regulator [bacterium]|nr:sigma-54-dependent Fis family transcriptional regulator [bacterium]